MWLRLGCSFMMVFLITALGCSKVPQNSTPPLKTVSNVDLDRYLGKWYEIARYPHSFEDGCYSSTAFYEKAVDGIIKVTNQCRKGKPQGELIEAVGKAKVHDKKTNAKLKVQFFWPFEGDYWIIHLDTDYQYAIVSEPTRQFLWILSRSSKMDPQVLESLKLELKNRGFDLSYLIMTPQ